MLSRWAFDYMRSIIRHYSTSTRGRLQSPHTRDTHRTLCQPTMDKHSNDFLSLPILISDYDALFALAPCPSASTSTTTSSSPTNPSTTTAPSSGPQPSKATPSIEEAFADTAARWTTGFATFTDALFSRMTQGAKSKLREACVEVLRRTEDADDDDDEGEQGCGVWGRETGEWGRGVDGDARFLD